MKEPKRKRTSDTGVEAKTDQLGGWRIAVAVSGGIGAVEVVKIIRELRRHGASVTAFLTPSVERFVTRLSLEWAAGSPAVLESSAEVDHLEDYDLVIVAPATLNTIAKSAVGIADNAVTLLVGTQLGRRAPILFVPAMNIALSRHPAYAGHRKCLEGWGAIFFELPVEEDRLKMPSGPQLAEFVVKKLARTSRSR